ncbi:histidine kinase N-terminal 7TM domain-containing protein [Halorientalis brevis]|uniref:histidine kinase n=1 Tax=Halorientalis brevis TaxID=1126241 RepID=A0ABD6CA73_9EURY|nr:histidine kinase N-terminal 7TM domain-containing protein [Halorientalis brevis]
MSTHAMLYHSILAVGILLCVGVGVYAWRRRERRGATLLVGIFATLVYWMATTSLIVHFAGTPIVRPIARSQFLAIPVLTLLLFLLALRYTGRERYITRKTVALLLVHPVLTNVAVWVPPLKQHFVQYGARDASSFFGYAFIKGPLFLVHTTYSYVLMGAAAVMFVTFAFRSEYIYQRQVGIFLVGVFAPWIGNVLYLFGPVSVDITSLAFAITGLALWWAMFSQDFLNIVPIARSTVVDNIGAGVFVLDVDDRVVDVNPKGRELLDLQNEDVIGRHATAALAGYPAVRDTFQNAADTTDEVEAEVDFGTNTYQVQNTPLSDEHDNVIGRLFLVNDVTEQKRRQQELERRNEQLEQFANVVSHDLRNPLNVASGKLELGMVNDEPEHFEDVKEAHERMNRIIDDVLTLARQGQQVDDRMQVSLQSLATRAWRNVETADAQLQVVADCPFAADESRLLRAFENLFRNAIEHGRETTTVTVGQTEDGFYVADDGPGIPADERDDVFEDGYTTNEDGTGFGLSIVESIVEAHGWEIAVTESESGGARFEVTGIASLTDRQPQERNNEHGPRSSVTESSN